MKTTGAFENRGFPDVSFQHLTPALRIAQKRILLHQRFHAIHNNQFAVELEEESRFMPFPRTGADHPRGWQEAWVS